MGRFPKFIKSLLDSPSLEVAVIARVVIRDATTTTGKNVLNVKLVVSTPLSKRQEMFSSVKVPVPDSWKFYLLEKYLKLRKDLQLKCEDTENIDDLISSLCST